MRNTLPLVMYNRLYGCRHENGTLRIPLPNSTFRGWKASGYESVAELLDKHIQDVQTAGSSCPPAGCIVVPFSCLNPFAHNVRILINALALAVVTSRKVIVTSKSSAEELRCRSVLAPRPWLARSLSENLTMDAFPSQKRFECLQEGKGISQNDKVWSVQSLEWQQVAGIWSTAVDNDKKGWFRTERIKAYKTALELFQFGPHHSYGNLFTASFGFSDVEALKPAMALFVAKGIVPRTLRSIRENMDPRRSLSHPSVWVAVHCGHAHTTEPARAVSLYWPRIKQQIEHRRSDLEILLRDSDNASTPALECVVLLASTREISIELKSLVEGLGCSLLWTHDIHQASSSSLDAGIHELDEIRDLYLLSLADVLVGTFADAFSLTTAELMAAQASEPVESPPVFMCCKEVDKKGQVKLAEQDPLQVSLCDPPSNPAAECPQEYGSSQRFCPPGHCIRMNPGPSGMSSHRAGPGCRK